MPILTTPPRLISAMLARLKKEKSDSGPVPQITQEQITAVNDHDVTVTSTNGVTTIPVSGSARLQAGDMVSVAWQGGKPTLALAHTARRAQFPPPSGGALGLVEELFIASAQGLTDVYFRNFAVVKPLNVRQAINANPQSVRWGADRASFVVRYNTYQFAIFSFKRPGTGTTPFAAGAGPAALLVKKINLTQSAATILNLTVSRQGSGTRWSVTAINEEPRTSKVQSYTLGPTTDVNSPFGCEQAGISTT